MYEDENDLFDWVPDMDLDGDHDLYDLMLLEDDEIKEKNDGLFDADEDDDPDFDDDREDEEDDRDDGFDKGEDEFDFTPAQPTRNRAKAEIVWADPLPNPAEAAAAKSSAPANQNQKVGFGSLLAFAVFLYLLAVIACYILLTLFSTIFLEIGENTDISKTVWIFSLIFSAIFIGWLAVPVSKKKDEWAFKAVNTVAVTLAGVTLVFFIVFCRLG